MTEKLSSFGLSPWGKTGASSDGKHGPNDYSLSNNAIGQVLFDLIPLLVIKVIQTNNLEVSDILGRAACSQLNNATNWVFMEGAKLLPTSLGELGLPGGHIIHSYYSMQ